MPEISTLGPYVCDHDYCDLEECGCACHAAAHGRTLLQAQTRYIAAHAAYLRNPNDDALRKLHDAAAAFNEVSHA